MDAAFYWDMTYKEILASIRGCAKRQESELQYQSIIAYHQANLISHLVGITLGSKQAQKAIHEAFPGIFPQLEQQAALINKKQQDWRIMKERINAYAAEKRKREAKQNGNDN